MKKILFSLATFALVAASAAESHRVTLYSDATVNGQQLKAGEYRLELDGSKAVLKKGKQTVEATVRQENGDQKFNATAVRFNNGDGSYKINEIRLGGTKTRVIFEQPAGAVRSAE
jgi:uncharacterized GH25 family protein